MEQPRACLEGLTLLWGGLDGDAVIITFQYAAGWGHLSVDGRFWPSDFTDFVENLERLYQSLSVQASLKPKYDNDCILTLTASGLGRMEGKVHLQYIQDRFEGRFGTDQSYLPPFLSVCRQWAQLILDT